MLYTSEPQDFSPKFTTVACFLQQNDKFLLLKRHKNKPQGHEWGLPAGKIHDGELPEETCVREIEEETGIRVKDLELVGKFYQKYPNYDFVLYVFKTALDHKPSVILNEQEHKDFKWVNPQESRTLPLMLDLNEVISKVYEGF